MTTDQEATLLHRFVRVEQVVIAKQPAAADLKTLFAEWGLTRLTQEALWVVAFDNVEGIKTVSEVAKGGFHDVLVHYPTVLAAVLSAHADRFYVAHNHPSGPVRPTAQDINLTAGIMAAANAAGMSFEDHIIVGAKGWYSFYEHGLMTGANAVVKKSARRPRPSSCPRSTAGGLGKGQK